MRSQKKALNYSWRFFLQIFTKLPLPATSLIALEKTFRQLSLIHCASSVARNSYALTPNETFRRPDAAANPSISSTALARSEGVYVKREINHTASRE